jgi:ribonuclease T2
VSSDQPAKAQAWQCRAPANLPRPKLEIPQKSQIRRTPVASYILAISWSPEYCRKRGKDAKNLIQCNGKIGDFGFILHGLWPEAKGPDYPQYCRSVGVLSRKVVANNICMTPDVQLLQHEWAKHGTCMARKPETYFETARLMFGAIEFPDMDRLSRQYRSGNPVNAAGMANAFAEINEGLPANSIKVKTNDRGWLEEIRVCLGKDFRPQRCPNFVQGAPAKAEVKIWRGS